MAWRFNPTNGNVKNWPEVLAKGRYLFKGPVQFMPFAGTEVGEQVQAELAWSEQFERLDAQSLPTGEVTVEHRAREITLTWDGLRWGFETEAFDVPPPPTPGFIHIRGPKGRAGMQIMEGRRIGDRVTLAGFPAYDGYGIFLRETAAGAGGNGQVYAGAQWHEWVAPAWEYDANEDVYFRTGGYFELKSPATSPGQSGLFSADVPFASQSIEASGDPAGVDRTPLPLREGADVFTATTAHFADRPVGGVPPGTGLTLTLSEPMNESMIAARLNELRTFRNAPDGTPSSGAAVLDLPGAYRLETADGRYVQDYRYRMMFTVPEVSAISRSLTFRWQEVTMGWDSGEAQAVAMSATAIFLPGQSVVEETEWRTIAPPTSSGFTIVTNFQPPEIVLEDNGPVIRFQPSDDALAVPIRRFMALGGSPSPGPIGRSVASMTREERMDGCRGCCTAAPALPRRVSWTIETKAEPCGFLNTQDGTYYRRQTMTWTNPGTPPGPCAGVSGSAVSDASDVETWQGVCFDPNRGGNPYVTTVYNGNWACAAREANRVTTFAIPTDHSQFVDDLLGAGDLDSLAARHPEGRIAEISYGPITECGQTLTPPKGPQPPERPIGPVAPQFYLRS